MLLGGIDEVIEQHHDVLGGRGGDHGAGCQSQFLEQTGRRKAGKVHEVFDQRAFGVSDYLMTDTRPIGEDHSGMEVMLGLIEG